MTDLKAIREEVKAKGWSRDLCEQLLKMVDEQEAQLDAVRELPEKWRKQTDGYNNVPTARKRCAKELQAALTPEAKQAELKQRIAELKAQAKLREQDYWLLEAKLDAVRKLPDEWRYERDWKRTDSEKDICADELDTALNGEDK